MEFSFEKAKKELEKNIVSKISSANKRKNSFIEERRESSRQRSQERSERHSRRFSQILKNEVKNYLYYILGTQCKKIKKKFN